MTNTQKSAQKSSKAKVWILCESMLCQNWIFFYVCLSSLLYGLWIKLVSFVRLSCVTSILINEGSSQLPMHLWGNNAKSACSSWNSIECLQMMKNVFNNLKQGRRPCLCSVTIICFLVCPYHHTLPLRSRCLITQSSNTLLCEVLECYHDARNRKT